MDGFILNDNRTMLPGLMISLKSDIMDCQVTWCRFAASKRENLDRKNHKHIIFEMHFVLEGSLVYNFPKPGRFTVDKKHFMLIPQRMMHTTQDGNPGVTEYLVIAFSPSSANSAINAIFSSDSMPLALPFTDVMENLISVLRMKEQEKNFTTSLSTKLIIHSILMEAVDGMIDHMGLNALTERIAPQNNPRVSSIVRIVNNNIYNQKLRGAEVAAQLGITPRQLNRICNQSLGCPINQYIIQTRIRGMQTLLLESSYTLTDIADIFGFSDVYAFIKHFTHFSGIAPGSYRKKQFDRDESVHSV